MKPYPRYKPTGLAWLPSVPEHWEIVPFKQLFTLGKGLPITKADLVESGTPVVSYGQIHSKTNTGTALSADLLRFVPSETAATKPTARLRKGDFAFADTSEDVAGCGNCVFNNRDDEVFGGYHTILAFNHRPEHGRYLSYLFQSPCWRDQIRRFANGVKVYSVTGRILNAATVTLPMASEQDRIVRYLDEKTAAVDELVRAKEREIELLRERKQALVSAAVTGGLDPATKLKDSGIFWIGKIPAHWIPIAIKRILLRNDGGVWGGDPTGNNDTVVLRSTEQTLEGDWCLSDPAKRHLSSQEKSMAILQKGDILVTKSSGSLIHIGKATLVSSQIEKQKCCYSNFMQRLRVKPTQALPSYLWRVLNSAVCKQQIHINATTTTGLTNLTGTIIGRMTIPLPPLPEQRRIVAHLDSVCADFASAETAIRKQIALLQELRTRLVSDAVTGAVEVG